MATTTTLSDEEQAAIFHAEGFRLAAGMAGEWGMSIATQTPFALCGAIDALAQTLATHLGAESTASFLDDLAAAVRSQKRNEHALNTMPMGR